MAKYRVVKKGVNRNVSYDIYEEVVEKVLFWNKKKMVQIMNNVRPQGYQEWLRELTYSGKEFTIERTYVQ